jgi:hypothetical protein
MLISWLFWHGYDLRECHIKMVTSANDLVLEFFMIARPLFVATLFLVSGLAFAEPPIVQDFRVTYRQDAGQPAAQEALRGLQRATELQSISGETLSHRRTLKDGTHEMRASRTMTRAEAWAMADKIRAANPSIHKVEPIDPEANIVQGQAPYGMGR